MDKSFALIPIESDPSIMTEYLRMMCLTSHYLIDLIDYSDESGLFSSHNVVAYIFLYEPKKELPFGTLDTSSEITNGIYFMKQVVPNSCATLALIHAYLNTVPSSAIVPSSALGFFFLKTKNMSSTDRGESFAFEENFHNLHRDAAEQGQSSFIQDITKVSYHFAAFVPFEGNIIELDGRKPGPVNHGPFQDGDFKKAALSVMESYMKLDPDNINFNIMALCAPKE